VKLRKWPRKKQDRGVRMQHGARGRTPKPKPSTLNSKIWTVNREPWTLNPRPETLHSGPWTFNRASLLTFSFKP
jgi:hypothetical protein